MKIKPLNNQPFKYNWGSVDWTKQDIRIAEELGCTRERVRQMRIRHNIARSPNHGVNRKNHDFGGINWSKSNLQLAHETGICRGVLSMARRRLTDKPSTYSRVYPWEDINWNLPNKTLNEIWAGGIQHNWGSNRTRRGHAPRWRMCSEMRNNRDFIAAVNAEREKVRKWRAMYQSGEIAVPKHKTCCVLLNGAMQ